MHDLRVEHAGQVAQIDHLLVNRLLQIYVLESNSFAEGLDVNEHRRVRSLLRGAPHGYSKPTGAKQLSRTALATNGGGKSLRVA